MSAGTNGPQWATFAGRAAELALLRAAADAAREAQLAALLISGEPGIGKTRLVQEACKYAGQGGFRVLVGRCFDTQAKSSYFPFVEIFRQLGTPAPGAADRATLRSARAIIGRLTRKPGVRRLHPSGQSDIAPDGLFESIAVFLRRTAAQKPLLLVLEDLHWADQGSLSMLLHIVRTSETAALLIVATCRERGETAASELRRALTELVRYRACQRIRLPGLAPADATLMVQRRLNVPLADDLQQLAATIVRIASGNPLFIDQMLRQLLESGRLSNQQGRWLAPSGWDSRVAAEGGLLELVDMRLARLSGACRQALIHAAVLGDEFEVRVLARMLRVAEAKLLKLFERAEAAGILVRTRGDQAADYCFAHSVIRQSLYERLSRPLSRSLHGRAARAIERVHRPELNSYLPQLALHYVKAGATTDLEKAIDYSIRAAELACAVCAYADATSHWRTALKMANDGADEKTRARILERLGESSLMSSATPAEAAGHLKAALKLYGDVGLRQDAARVHARLVTVLSMTSAAIDVGQAMSHARDARDLLIAGSNRIAEGEWLIGEAIVAHVQFRTDDGLVVSQRAMALGEAVENSELWCQAAALHGHFLWASGKLAAGLALMERAFARAAETHNVRSRLASTWLLGFSHLLLWDPGTAERALRRGLAEGDDNQAELLRRILVAHLGVAHLFTGLLAEARSLLAMAPHPFLEANLLFYGGQWPEAERLLRCEIERADAAQSKQLHWTASFWLARLKLVAGEYDQALKLLQATPLISQGLRRLPEEIVTRAELALIHLAGGEMAQAQAELLRCRTLLTGEEDWRALPAFVARAEAAILMEQHRLEEARGLFVTAVQLLSQYRAPGEVAETLVMWGAALLRAGQTAEGMTKLDSAAQLYRHLQLGAVWHARLEQLKRVTVLPPPDAALLANIPVSSLTVSAAPAHEIYSLATTNDVALLATLVHDAIAHLMNAIDKASKLRGPLARIAAAAEKMSRPGAPIDRIARALERGLPDPAANSYAHAQRTRSARKPLRLGRGHDPGRPL